MVGAAPTARPQRRRSPRLLVIALILTVAVVLIVAVVFVVRSRSADEDNGPQPNRVLDLGTGELRAMVLSPDGTEVAVGTDNDEVRVYSVRDGRVRLTLSNVSGTGVDLAYSPDGSMLAAAGRTGVAIWDTRTGRERVHLHPAGGASAVAFMSDDRIALLNSSQLSLVNVATPTAVQTIARGKDVTSWNDLVVGPGGTWLAAVGSIVNPHVVTILRTRDGQRIQQFGRHDQAADVAFSADGAVATVLADGQIIRYDVRTGNPIGSPVRGGPLGATTLALSRDGRRLAASGYESGVRIWDPVTGAQVGRTILYRRLRLALPVKALAYTPDRSELLVVYSRTNGSEAEVWPTQ
jgi:WD40 repeat protein